MLALPVRGALVADPVKDYLESVLAKNGYLERFYSDDVLYRLNFDLDGDGSLEVLLSVGRDSSGREGNTWAIYKVSSGVAERVGEAVFNAQRFYLGQIDEVNQYGIVSFSPAGGGPGSFNAYTFDGNIVSKSEIGKVERDETTLKLKGEELVEKYSGEKADIEHTLVTTTPISELVFKYKLDVSAMTYSGYVQSQLTLPVDREAPKNTSVFSARSVSGATGSSRFSPVAHPVKGILLKMNKILFWAFALLVLAAGIVVKTLRKRK